MWKGDLTGKISTDSLNHPHAYGLGPIEYLKGQKELMRLVYSRDTMLDLEKALSLTETFLHLFENAEEYELCASLIKTWPELKK